MVQQHTWYGMLCSNFTYTTGYSKIKDKKKKIETFPYLPTKKLKNISETDLFSSRREIKRIYKNDFTIKYISNINR